MRATIRTWVGRLCWLALPLGAIALGYLADPAWSAAAHGFPASARPGDASAAAQGVCAIVPDAADPWAFSPTGNPPHTAYGPGEGGPGLLP